MDPSSDSASFREQSLSALKGLTRATNQLASQDLAFHKSLDSTVGPAVDEQGNKILDLANSLLRCVAGSDKNAPHLTDEDSVEDNWRSIVDVIDGLLEKADACLDEFTGLIKKNPQNTRDQKANATDAKAKFPNAYSRTSKIPKPQTEFENAPDNTNNSEPWKPLLTSKPHSTVSLSESLQPRDDGSYPNPYEAEIKQARYPSAAYVVAEPQGYLPFESTTATFVDTFEGVKKMLSQLKQAKEIAIDLEHHDTHSYQGIVCLMQISTRDADWIVDTLKPWRQDLQILNEVFADPKIMKVFHGAFMDMIWLQRDLGIYVVNLFDTFHAANALGYPKKSLKYLLDKFVNFQAEKQYQMADWRLRPLLPGMFDYARSDTHYLLYIYDLMRNELVENSDAESNLVDYVSDKSKEESLQRFERPTYDVETGKGSVGWYDLLLKSSVLFSKEQFAVFKAVHRWRDEVARAEDEGLQYVLAKHALFRIAHSMPVDAVTLLRAAAPVSPVVRAHVLELVELVKKAKLEGANGPELRDVLHPLADTPKTVSRPGTPTEKTHFGVPVVERAELSQFWGAEFHTPEPSLINFHSIDSAIEAFFLSLPMPAKSVDPADNAAAAVQTQAQAPVTTTAEEATTSQKTPKKPSNDIFTAKTFTSSSKKRKHEDTEDAPQQPSSSAAVQPEQSTSSTAPPTDELSLEGGQIKIVSPSPQMSKNQRKRRRQAEKRLARQQLELQEQEKRGQQPQDTGAAASATAASQPSAEANATPAAFDYTQAESVLHAAAPQSSTTGHQKKKKKNFNPYAKATHTGTGLGRIKRDTTGRSHTFK
ncbi:exosome complex exonuclease RRP6 [Ascosphaera apis ARSEF 7405]|uniref:Exosome complex exonuclease RRP6 n=1 Tax=Ascosphaera apis ARSEF 7405 TaxID=392613 RepID=A0A168BTS5_9EURO|nr:exosome complex exonuclease RRP6 [Ascosphaera apis ARSEF 7405]